MLAWVQAGGLGGVTLVLKGPGREVDDRKWTEWAGKLVVNRRGGALPRYLDIVCSACPPESVVVVVVELARVCLARCPVEVYQSF